MIVQSLAIVSGGFDPIHVGHIRLISDALLYGTEVLVILNNDNWLLQKKGFVFMPEQERREVLKQIKGVREVLTSFHKPDTDDTSVLNELTFARAMYPTTNLVFCNGGDRRKGNLPTAEEDVCELLDIRMAYNVGGGKIQSSSELVKRFKSN